jgi:cold shock protein
MGYIFFAERSLRFKRHRRSAGIPYLIAIILEALQPSTAGKRDFPFICAGSACEFTKKIGMIEYGVIWRTASTGRDGTLGFFPAVAALAHMANYDNNGFQPLAQASAKGTIKWFNISKGYGFVTLENGGDAFCHASAFSSLGITNIPQGATIICDLQDTQRGLQVVAVHTLDVSTATQSPRRLHRDFGDAGGYDRMDSGPTGPMVEGKVKFFNDQKGFGFVVPDDGSADVYVHASALRRSGVQTLQPEQRIRYSTRQGMKGVEVDRVEIV